LLGLAMAVPLQAGAAAGPVVTLAQHDRTIRLARGETLTLRLESNGTTGYQWEIASLPSNLRRISDSYDASTQKRVSAVAGAGGNQVFVLKGAAAGRGTLRLVYRQPWNRKDPPDRSFRLVVVTR
jgi:predicted secreted protein